jgi:hypothetical protein
LWTFDVSSALEKFVLFIQEGGAMSPAQQQQRHAQRQQQHAPFLNRKPGGRASAVLLPPPMPQALLDIVVRCLAAECGDRFKVNHAALQQILPPL